MADTPIGRLLARLTMDEKDFRKGFGRAERLAQQSGKRMAATLRRSLGALGAGLATRAIVQHTVAQENAVRKLAQAIETTGRAGKISVAEIERFSSSIQRTTNYGDEAVIALVAFQLQFRNISEKVLPRATKAVLDFASFTGREATQSAKLFGVALNDPITGMGRLSQAGVSLDQDLKETIKTLQQSGRLAEAQALFLDELEKSFGGAAEAARQTLGGALASLKNAAGDLLEQDGLTGTRVEIERLTAVLQDPQFRASLSGVFELFVKGFRLAAEGAAALAEHVDLLKIGVGALIGLAVGGPIGALIGGLVGLVARTDEVERSVYLAKEATDLLNDAQGRAIGLTRDLAVERLNEAKAALEEARATEAIRKEAEKNQGFFSQILEAFTPFTPDSPALTQADQLQLQIEDLERAIRHADERARSGATGIGLFGDAADDATKPTIELAKAVDKSIDQIRIENDALQRTLDAYGRGADAVEAVTRQLEIESAVRNLGASATAEQVAAITEEITKRQELTELIDRQIEATEKAAKEAESAAADAANVIEQPFLNAAENIQREFGNIFTDIFRDGVDSFKDLGNRILDIMARTAGEIAALLVFRPQVLAGGLGGILGGIGLFGAAGASASTGGLGGGSFSGIGSLISGSLGALIGGGVTGLASGVATGIALQVGAGGKNLGEKIGGYIGSLIGGAIGGRYAGQLGATVGGTLGNFILGGLGGGLYNFATTGSLFGPGMSRLQQASYAYANPFHAFLGLDIPSLAKPFAIPAISSANLFLGGLPALFAGLFGLFDDDFKLQLQTAAAGAGRFHHGISGQGPFGAVGLSTYTHNFGARITQQITDFFLAVDEQIAELLDPAEVARAAEALQTTTALRKKFGDFDDEISELIRDRLITIIDAVAGEEGFTKRVDVFEGIKFGRGQETEFFERAAQFLSQRADFVAELDRISGASGPISEAAQALEALDDQFAALAASADALGVAQSKVTEAQDAARRQLIEGFGQGIQDQILAILNPFELAFRELERAQEARLASARDFGADLVEVERLNLLERERLLQGYAVSAEDLLQRLTAGPGSPLAPTEVLAAAESEFERLRTAVLGGDLGQLDALVSAAENLLTVSRDVFASGDQFFERFRFVVATLENITTASLPGFQHGGSFTVPGGGTDNVVPLIRMSGGETASVTTREQSTRRDRVLAEIAVETSNASEDRREESRELIREIRALREIVARHHVAIERLARRRVA